MAREEEIRNAIDTIFPIPSSEKGRKYEQALMATGFEAGVKWADEHPKSPWISVKDDLPCNHEELIIDDELLDKHTKPVICIKSYGVSCVGIMIYNVDRNAWHWVSEKPTHWFPIPELPKEKKIK